MTIQIYYTFVNCIQHKMKQSIRISSETKLCRDKNQLFSEIDDELVMLSVENGEYYSLNSVGKEIWKLTETPVTFNLLIVSLMKLYLVTKNKCEIDTIPFLEEMINKGIIKIVE